MVFELDTTPQYNILFKFIFYLYFTKCCIYVGTQVQTKKMIMQLALTTYNFMRSLLFVFTAAVYRNKKNETRKITEKQQQTLISNLNRA